MTIKVYFKPGSDGSMLDPYRRRKPLVLDEITNYVKTTEKGYFFYTDKDNRNHWINKDVIDEIIVEETQQ